MRYISYILFLFLTIITYGQVTIYADTDRKDLRINEPFTLTIILDVRGEEFIQESSVKLPDLSKFNIIGSGSNREVVIDKSTNTHINRLMYIIGLEAKKIGTLKIGSVLTQFNGKMYKTEPFDIIVRDGEKKETIDNIYFSMEAEQQELYPNQPTIVVLRAYSSNYQNLRNIGKVTFPKQEEVKVLPVDIKPSEIEQDAKTGLVSQIIAKAMLMPKNSGNTIVKPVSILYNENNGLNLSSNKLNINVKEFPNDAPKGFKNLVGDYKVELKTVSETNKYSLNEPINIQLKITGKGSLEQEHLPKILESKDYALYQPTIKTNIKNTSNGRTGYITANYILIPKKVGKIKILTENFSFFNPNKNKYKDLEIEKLILDITPKEPIKEEQSTIERVSNYTQEVLTTNHSVNDKQKTNPEHFIGWDILYINYFLLVLFIALFLLCIWYYRKKTYKKKHNQPRAFVSIQDIENEIKKNQLFDWETHLSYLNKLLSEQNFSDFFQSYETLIKDAEYFVNKQYKLDVKTYLAQRKGRQYAEAYNRVLQEIQIEKYAPIHCEEHLKNLIEDSKEIFSIIV